MIDLIFKMRWWVLTILVFGSVPLAATNAADHYRLGLDAAAKSNYTVAVRELSTAKQQNPRLPGIDKQLGLALFQAKEFEKAIPVLNTARRTGCAAKARRSTKRASTSP